MAEPSPDLATALQAVVGRGQANTTLFGMLLMCLCQASITTPDTFQRMMTNYIEGMPEDQDKTVLIAVRDGLSELIANLEKFDAQGRPKLDVISGGLSHQNSNEPEQPA
jgi:hypothetical protein